MSEIGDVLMPERALTPQEIDQRLEELAHAYHGASGPGLRFLTFLGARADHLLERLPEGVRDGLAGASEQALLFALRQSGGRKLMPQLPPKSERLVGAALGAIGGAGGVAGTLAELPITTAFLLRTIQEEARRNGFDPLADSVQFDTIRIFAAPGPFGPDISDTGYLVTRLGLSGGGLQKLVAQVAPRLGIALGQKLAAQAAPVIGSAAGASCNYLYAGYYQNVAKVHFAVRRLAIDCDIAEVELTERLSQKISGFDR